MTDVMLPYRTEWPAIETLLDYAKGKGIDRAMLEARLGAGESLRETLNAAEQLGLVRRDDSSDIRLTSSGERLAYAASETERGQELARAMLTYPPYAIPLERAIAASMSVLDGPWVERVWQVDMRLRQPRNRVEEARTFFFRLADHASLGTYRRGVRGQPTRLELDPRLATRLDDLREQTADLAHPVDEPPASDPVPTTTPLTVTSRSAGPVSLSVTVDMTEWDLDKIEAFLRLVGIVSDD